MCIIFLALVVAQDLTDYVYWHFPNPHPFAFLKQVFLYSADTGIVQICPKFSSEICFAFLNKFSYIPQIQVSFKDFYNVYNISGFGCGSGPDWLCVLAFSQSPPFCLFKTRFLIFCYHPKIFTIFSPKNHFAFLKQVFLYSADTGIF